MIAKCHLCRLGKMSKQELLKQYRKDVDNVRNCAKDLGLSDKEINLIFKKCFNNLKNKTYSSKPNMKNNVAQRIFLTVTNISLLFTIFAIFIYILLNVHQPTSSIVLRNVQGLTYPTLKFVRLLSVPVIKMFPFLTDFYDETCLLENPYFYVADMECWPCENVHAVLDITGLNDESTFKSGSGTPFIVKTNQKLITFADLKDMYMKNKEMFDSEARQIKTTNTSISTLQELFTYGVGYQSSKTHISWRINKMVPARIIRNLFPRPSFISERAGQSVERFIMIDEAKTEHYLLPNTECSYIFVIQGSGERTIVLRPSRECTKDCRTVSVVLKPSYVLWYNWWYWRPISLPTENSTEPSITYINSYC